MKFVKTTIATSILAAISISANAATINLETASYTGSSPADFEAAWNAATPFQSSSLTEFSGVRPGNNTINKLSIDFGVGQSADLSFRFGLDAGKGAAVYLNDSLVTHRSDDLWWSNNYNNSNEVITFSTPTLSAGNQSLDVYWAEGCCNGASAGQFSIDGTNWQDLSVSNLSAVSAVPEPSTYAMMIGGLGLVGLMAARRKKA